MSQTTRKRDDVWIRRFHPADHSGVQLICFPHAGGSASFYHPLSRSLQPDIDVLAVQYPGRQDRRQDPCIADIRELAAAVADSVHTWSDRPFALFGHSMGAMVAYETALRLRQRYGLRPARLFVSGRRAPSRQHNEEILKLGDTGLIAEMRRLSGTDDRLLLDAEALQMILPAMRADYRAIESYQYQPVPALDCPVDAFVGSDDPKAPVEDVRAWTEHTDQEFSLRVLPGGHFYLREQMPELIAAIRGGLRPHTSPAPSAR
jgi:surfactin synthase thioesterase subunit